MDKLNQEDYVFISREYLKKKRIKTWILFLLFNLISLSIILEITILALFCLLLIIGELVLYIIGMNKDYQKIQITNDNITFYAFVLFKKQIQIFHWEDIRTITYRYNVIRIQKENEFNLIYQENYPVDFLTMKSIIKKFHKRNNK